MGRPLIIGELRQHPNIGGPVMGTRGVYAQRTYGAPLFDSAHTYVLHLKSILLMLVVIADPYELTLCLLLVLVYFHSIIILLATYRVHYLHATTWV
jgi:hypothetical protein